MFELSRTGFATCFQPAECVNLRGILAAIA